MMRNSVRLVELLFSVVFFQLRFYGPSDGYSQQRFCDYANHIESLLLPRHYHPHRLLLPLLCSAFSSLTPSSFVDYTQIHGCGYPLDP